jgi:hypothetical protein
MVSIFPLQTSHLYVATSPSYGVYISQLIRYSRACGSNQDFLERGLLLTRKSSLRKFYGHHHDLVPVTEYLTNPTKNRTELRCSGRVGSSCSTSDTRCVTLATNPVISHKWWRDREVLSTGGKSNIRTSIRKLKRSLKIPKAWKRVR